MHGEIKTYELTDKNGQQAGFILKDMGKIYADSGGKPDRPHRHDYFTILLVEEAQGKHFIDFKEYDFFPHSLHFIHPGQVHQVVATTRPVGWIINFSRLFLFQNGITDQIIDDVYLFKKHGESPPLPVPDGQFNVYQSIVKQIQHYDNLQLAYKAEALGALLKLLLIQSNSHCTLNKAKDLQLIETGNHLVRKFKQLIEIHFKEFHKVSDYADMLSVTSDYLNKSVKSLTGKSAKEYILSRIILEAKRVLLFTEQTNKELAYSLGFEEPAHFSNFFKKYNGISPIDFRNSARQS